MKEELSCLSSEAMSIPTIVADNQDMDSLHRMVEQSQTILTTVGPYQALGTPLVCFVFVFLIVYII